jgi:hypothetical protein
LNLSRLTSATAAECWLMEAVRFGLWIAQSQQRIEMLSTQEL